MTKVNSGSTKPKKIKEKNTKEVQKDVAATSCKKKSCFLRDEHGHSCRSGFIGERRCFLTKRIKKKTQLKAFLSAQRV